MHTACELPDDPKQLKLLVLRMRAELVEAKLKLQKAQLELALYRRQKFGASSERLQELGQLQLLVEELEVEQRQLHEEDRRLQAPATATTDEESCGTRKPLPAHLPREHVQHEPRDRCTCEACGGQLKYLGEDTSEQLEIAPARFKLIRHVRPKYACGRSDAIVQASAAKRPIERGVAGSGLLAHVLVSKYADHRVPRARPPP
jgi:transposase